MDLARIAAEYGISTDEVRGRYLALRAAMWKADFSLFCRDAVKIRTKSGDLEPLVLNEAQLILHEAGENMLDEEGWVRLIGLKGRRQGFSTYVAARGYYRATLWDRQRIYILSHEMTASNTLFGMVALMQEKNPFPPAVGTDNAKELEFVKRGSSYAVATAGQKAGGRGGAVSFFHGSEAAWWTNAEDHFSSSVQSVDEVRGVKGVLWRRPGSPLPFEMKAPEAIHGWIKAPSEIWLETTSAGPNGTFFQKYMEAMKGKGRYRHVFVPWTVQTEYRAAGDFTPEMESDEEGELSEYEYQGLHKLTDAQMLWRREKIQETSIGRFRQEYPIDVTEAFAAADIEGVFIKPAAVLRARKRSWDDIPDAPLIIGVDPAGSGGDRFAVAFRRGDVCFRIKARTKLEHDEAVAWLASIIDEHKPQRMNIDRGTFGANIISSLRALKKEYADIVRGVDFGGTSRAKQAHPKRAGPVNRRAEMYGDCNEWLKQGGCIPDDDDLASDLSGPKQMFRANNDWLLESKTDMKKRGLRSPDLADALVLTFAFREFFDNWSKPTAPRGFEAGVPADAMLGHNGGPTLDEFDVLSNSDYGWMG